jgi:hypothetical protein
MEKQEQTVEQSLGSYNFLIAENILNKFNLKLSSADIEKAFKDKNSPYFHLLKVPMLNCLNGMVYEQCETYKLFCQKRLTDFVLNVNPTLDELKESGGAFSLPESITQLGDELVVHQAHLRELEIDYYEVLAKTQSYLIGYVKKQIISTGTFVGNYDDSFFKEMDSFEQRALSVQKMLVENRESWHEFAISVTKVISDLASFTLPPEVDFEQRSQLNFLRNLGGVPKTF